MTWLAIVYAFSLGTLSYTGQTFDQFGSATLAAPPSSYQTTLSIEAELLDNHVFASGSVQTWETMEARGFAPFEAFYVVTVGAHLAGFELAYRHECDHSILSTFDSHTLNTGLGVNRDEIYLSYSAKVTVF